MAKNINILLVASAGGHLVQLLRLLPAFEGKEVSLLTTRAVSSIYCIKDVYIVADASSWEKLKLIWMFVSVFWIVLKSNPSVIITTGAAPGLAAVIFGKILGRKTVWIDSVANCETMSRSGELAKRFSDIWLTQWPHLIRENGPDCWGKVI